MTVEDVLPTLILVALVYGLYRWLTGPPSDPLASVKREMVDAVSSVFPNEPVENIVYSLTLTHSPQATSEILLERGSLPAPPPGFIVPDNLRITRPIPSSATVPSSAPVTKAKPTSLIERYGLSSRVNEDASTANAKWSATKEGREADLKARKERMILEARRRMLEKQKSTAKVE